MTIELLTTSEAASRLKVSPGFLAHARLDGTGPAYVKLGRRAVRYRPEALDAWLNQHAKGVAAEGAEAGQ